jgi:arsenate reductase (thioredoxin)
MICFSKKFGDPFNPQYDFAAIMTCSDADENCPFVPGATKRFSITYIDPKESDGTPQESETYDERCRQIAREMLFMLKLATD